MRTTAAMLAIASLCVSGAALAQPITAASQPAQLDVRVAGDHSLRITLKPLTFRGDFPPTPAIVDRPYPASALTVREATARGFEARRQPGRRGQGPAADADRAARRARSPGARVRAGRQRVVPARRPAGAGDGRRRPAAGGWTPVARATGAVRSARAARHHGASLAERHVRLAQSSGDAAGHLGMGTVRGHAMDAGRPAGSGARPLRAVHAAGAGRRAPDGEEPAAGARQGIAADGSGRARPRRSLRLRRRRPAARAEGLLHHHRSGGHAAEVGARLHAVAPHDRERHAARSASSTASARSGCRSMR